MTVLEMNDWLVEVSPSIRGRERAASSVPGAVGVPSRARASCGGDGGEKSRTSPVAVRPRLPAPASGARARPSVVKISFSQS